MLVLSPQAHSWDIVFLPMKKLAPKTVAPDFLKRYYLKKIKDITSLNIIKITQKLE